MKIPQSYFFFFSTFLWIQFISQPTEMVGCVYSPYRHHLHTSCHKHNFFFLPLMCYNYHFKKLSNKLWLQRLVFLRLQKKKKKKSWLIVRLRDRNLIYKPHRGERLAFLLFIFGHHWVKLVELENISKQNQPTIYM